MKKKLFLGLLAAAAVTFTACQKDEVINEVPQDQAIGFGTYVGRDAQTKATVTRLTDLQNSANGFGVFAYYTGANDYESTTKPEFMYNQQVKYETSAWKYNPLKYWPGAGQQVSFFAYAPYVSAVDTKITALPAADVAVDPTIGFTVPTTVSDQIDLLYAEPKTNLTSGKVDFTFKHALSRIGFKVKTTNEEYRIKISEITLTANFNNSGTLNLYTGNWSGTSAGERTYSLTFTPSYITSNAGVAISAEQGYAMVIPTNLTSTEIQISVTYKYQSKVSATEWSSEEVEKTQSGSVGVNLVKGYAYTFVLTLDPGTAIVFDVTDVSVWDTEDGHETPVTTTLQ